MTTPLDIAEVARRTGLSARALRFYEARGLVRPLRTHSGRRCYGAGELERLHQLLTLKRAGLSLARIKALFDRRPVDLRALLALQLGELDAKAAALAEMRAVLRATLSRLDRGEPIDAATFCSLIKQGDQTMTTEKEKWAAVTDRYLTAEAKADFAARRDELNPEYAGELAAKWKELGSRIKAALPLDPASSTAQGFVAEWQALMAPFLRVATPAMMESTGQMYARMEEWEGEADPGFDVAVFRFIQEAMRAAKG